MANSGETHELPRISSIAMLATLGGISMLSGLLIVTAYQLTKPIIKENQRIATEAAIFQVVPGAIKQRRFVVKDKNVFPSEEGGVGTIVYAGYDKDGKLVGIASQAAAQGYADVITLLFGYDPECQCIRGMKVLKNAETPGLGDKIKFDKPFLENFVSLNASLNADGTALNNPIITVKHGAKKNDWEIDAISGATVSSRAVGTALNKAAQALLPQLVPHLETLRKGYPDSPAPR
jgi:electron transport complex protein RnfG